MAFDTTVEEASEAPEPTEAVEHDEAQAEPVETDEVEQDEQTQGDDDADDESNDESDAEPEPEPEKKGGRASERIKQLVAEKKAFEAELEKLRQQSQQPQQPRQTANSDGAPVKPNIEDYDLDNGLDDYFAAQAEYEEKHQDWKLDQRLQQREQAKQQEQRQQQTMSDFKQAFDADPDFKANFAELQTWVADKPIEADPSELYQGKELMDVLAVIAGDADLYYELADMTETQQYAKYGQIYAQTQAKKGKAPIGAKVSKAPKPPNHTNANAPIKRDIYSQSDDDFLRSRGL